MTATLPAPPQVLRDRAYDSEARAVAAAALGSMGNAAAPAVNELRKALRWWSPREMRLRAAEALGKLALAAVPALPELCKALGGDIGMVAAESLAQIGRAAPQMVIPELVKAMWRLREAIFCCQALGDEDFHMHEPAAEALRNLTRME